MGASVDNLSLLIVSVCEEDAMIMLHLSCVMMAVAIDLTIYLLLYLTAVLASGVTQYSYVETLSVHLCGLKLIIYF